jgi:hypothetical protein
MTYLGTKIQNLLFCILNRMHFLYPHEFTVQAPGAT